MMLTSYLLLIPRFRMYKPLPPCPVKLSWYGAHAQGKISPHKRKLETICRYNYHARAMKRREDISYFSVNIK
jgi:hypothetical protein